MSHWFSWFWVDEHHLNGTPWGRLFFATVSTPTLIVITRLKFAFLCVCVCVYYMCVYGTMHRFDFDWFSSVLTFQLFKSAASFPGLPSVFFFTLHMTHLGNLVSFRPENEAK